MNDVKNDTKEGLSADEVIQGVLRTEKAVKMVSYDRIIPFIVHIKATKKDIKRVVEEMFKAEVEKVRTHINRKGKKIAFVKFSPETDVESIASSIKLV